MSLQAMILSLISGIKDPTLRIDIASTVNYLFGLFQAGAATEGQIRDSLYEILYDVIRATYSDLTDEEVKKKAATLTDQFMRTFKVESVKRRVMTRIRPQI